MATRMLRRGLPRVTGGEPWPPAGDVEAEVETVAPAAEASGPPPAAATLAAESASANEERVGSSTVAPAVASPPASAALGARLRRGLPRTPGGEPWPPADVAPTAVPTAAEPSTGTAAAAAAATTTAAATTAPAAAPVATAEASSPRAERAAAATPAAASSGEALRRGLPRTPGGDPWPPAGTVALVPVAAAAASAPAPAPVTARTAASEEAAAPPRTALATVDVSTPLPFQRTVFAGKNAFTRPAPAPEPQRIGPFTRVQWAGAVIVGGLGLLGAAAMAVLLVRWLLSLSGMQDFLQTYPGEYHLPDGAPVGFPGWLGWQHFFNVFLMVLIIRSGLSVRNDKRPTAFWTARGDKKSKISLTLWFHQALDILWLVNGIIFVVLLFATGQWMRVIPTSWEVIPNALSATLQYVSLDWPTENGWVNYNSLQQLAYGTTIFIAAPLAAITGARMSGIWPKNAAKLNKAYPIEWARAVHFPVMLYFVAFIAIHVFLVFATGALRNLNHMYASLGSTDPNAYADNWTGFWFLMASLVVIAAAWVAARPMVLAPIAKLFGNVSAR